MHAPRLRPASGWLRLVAGLIGLLLAAPSARAAEPPVTIENVRVGYNDQYKIGTWTPVSIDLKAGNEALSGYVEVVVADDDGTSTFRQKEVQIEGRGFVTVLTYVRPGARNGDIRVRVLNERGRILTDIDATERNGRSVNALEPGQIQLLTVGNPRGVDEIAALSGFATPSAAGQISDLAITNVPPREMPSAWYGYDAASVIVVDTSDPTTMAELNQRFGNSLEQWVRNGGHLVLAVQSNWQLVMDGPLAATGMLPATIKGTRRLNDLGSLESFAGSSTPIPAKDLTVAVLEGAKRSGILCETSSTPPAPIVVRGTHGFGRVTLVGLDVDGKPFSDWKDKALFWVKVLDLHGRGEQVGPTATVPGAFYQNNATDLSSLLHRSLEQFAGVKLVPFGWVAFFVFIYILLIGPGDYFFLKKVVKRMELTWITFPVIVITVSLAAYAAAYAVKGTDLRINKVDVLDVDASTGMTRGTTWATIFSPQNRDYTISVVPTAVDRDPKSPPPAKAAAGTQMMVTWFGAADPRFVSGNANRLNLAGSGYTYGPSGEAEELRGVRVPIWSTKSVTARWLTPPANPYVEADLIPTGTNRVDGTITNLTKGTLRNAALVVGKQIYDRLGDIAPGASVRIDNASRTRPLAGYLEEHAKSYQNYLQTYNQSVSDETQASAIQRPDLVRSLMFYEASGKQANIQDVPLHDLDLTGQLALERPMLIAEVDGAACDLRLGGASAVAKLNQTTLLRVILPEPSAAQEKASAEEASK